MFISSEERSVMWSLDREYANVQFVQVYAAK